MSKGRNNQTLLLLARNKSHPHTQGFSCISIHFKRGVGGEEKKKKTKSDKRGSFSFHPDESYIS